jgi:DNA-binding LacI/PurR family transcriptional regulator
VELLMKKIKGEEAADNTVIETILVVRNSTRKL